ncbi:hypothetical protein [Hymenobacter sp. YC55]|uniref:hypothetical protein n=1 Tax=Hymenobacter sp. YC55 TaxID=3034019 RepID=UPI0023F91C28|nr:hypothetical protein [Hymenobacter sp. YC55]MDF7815742.1 hypothetical protein [Hymenobacter sp. YC55]
MPAPLASHPPLPPAVPEPALYQVFEQSPAAMCLLRGPQHALAYYNPAYQALFPGRDMRGRMLAYLRTALDPAAASWEETKERLLRNAQAKGRLRCKN